MIVHKNYPYVTICIIITCPVEPLEVLYKNSNAYALTQINSCATILIEAVEFLEALNMIFEAVIVYQGAAVRRLSRLDSLST